MKAFLLYFMSGLRHGFHQLNYRNLEELHIGLEKELLRMECLKPYGIQHREACSQAAKQSEMPLLHLLSTNSK